MKNKDETDPEKIKILIARGEYVIKELEALYMLRKYRTLKNRYYGDKQEFNNVQLWYMAVQNVLKGSEKVKS